MADEPDNLVLAHLRELREEVARRFDATDARVDRIEIEMGDLRAEMRGTRTALTGVGYLVNLSTGDLKTEIGALATEVNDLKADVNDLKADVSELKADVNELKAGVGDLKTEVRGLGDRLERRERERA